MTRLSSQNRSIERPLPVVAHYDAMLAEAVEKSSDPSPAGRAALYENIRTRLVSNLRSVRLSTSIESELCTFDEAVNRLEAYINEKEERASAKWSSEPIEFKPTRSNRRRDNSLALASRDDAFNSGSTDPDETDPATLDSWRSDVLARALSGDAPEIQSASKGRLKRPLRSPTSRFAGSEDALPRGQQGARQLVPVGSAPTETRRRSRETSDGSLRSEEPHIFKRSENVTARDAIPSNRQLALPMASMGEFPETAPEPAQGWAPQRKWLIAIGGVAAVFALAVVAMTFLSDVSLSSVSDAGPPPLAASSLQLPTDESTSPSQSHQISNRGDRHVGNEQSERALQQFMRWGQKADSGVTMTTGSQD